jgi:hypothetical protein
VLLFWDPGSGMGKNQDPGSEIRDKHPGSATLDPGICWLAVPDLVEDPLHGDVVVGPAQGDGSPHGPHYLLRQHAELPVSEQ